VTTTDVAVRPFTSRFTVRTYELDQNGHLNGNVYVQWADHARWECARAAGISVDDLVASGVGPVNLETTVRFHRELRAGAEVDVSCSFEWGDGKTMRVRQEFRLTDGTLAAELVSVGGLLDLEERRLVPDPRERWRGLARTPELLGL
jgi:acyl-CoA thioester hydrolase